MARVVNLAKSIVGRLNEGKGGVYFYSVFV